MNASLTAPYDQVLRAMRQELKRNLKRLRLPGLEPPYFISYLVRDQYHFNVWGNDGAVFYLQPEGERYRHIYVEVRVGSREFDNTVAGGLHQDLSKEESHEFRQLPVDDDPLAIRRVLWRLTDIKYKEALSSFLRKKSQLLKRRNRFEGLPCLSREEPVQHYHLLAPAEWPRDHWVEMVRKTSASFRRCRHLTNSWVRLQALRERVLLVNSEGTEIVTEDDYFKVTSELTTLADDGMPLEQGWHHYCRDLEEMPTAAAIAAALEQKVELLMRTRRAPLLEPYSGPALLSPEAAGVFFHEAVGHRLEGERLLSDDEGHTYAGRLGHEILPSFLNISDDPTCRRFRSRSVWGSYEFDDEGVPAQRVDLVSRGVLRNYLLSRTPVPGFERSNGHGRHASYEFPTARMGVFRIEAQGGLSREELKGALLEEMERQKKRWGLRLEEVASGETNTSSYDFQGFAGTPRVLYQVDGRTGRERLVRGVEFIGTPLLSAAKVLAAGRDLEIHHHYCGAESGWIRVSTISPSILVSEIELQRMSGTPSRPPILPPPR